MPILPFNPPPPPKKKKSVFTHSIFCLGTEVPRLSALGVGPTVRGMSEVQSAQEWKCKVHNSILQNGGLD